MLFFFYLETFKFENMILKHKIVSYEYKLKKNMTIKNLNHINLMIKIRIYLHK